MYEGTDNRENLQKTLGQLTQDIRSLEGSTIKVHDKEYIIKLYCLFDLCALNSVLGKQNHSATFPDAWTDVSKDHLSLKSHNGTPHTPETCSGIRFMNLEDLASNYTQHTVKAGQPSGLNKTGRDFGSVIHHNLLPIEDLFRCIPPLLHIVMGCGNDTFLKLKIDVMQLDVDETGVVNDDKYIEKINNSSKNIYEQKETLESEFNDIQVAHMISMIYN